MLRKILILLIVFTITESVAFTQNSLRFVKWGDGQLQAQVTLIEDIPLFRGNILIKFIDGEVSLKLINTSYEEVQASELWKLKQLDLKGYVEVKSEMRTISKEKYLYYELLPLRINPENGKIEKLISFDIELVTKFTFP